MTPISRSRENIILLLIGLLGLLIFVYAFPRVQKSAQLDLEFGRQEALLLTKKYIDESAPGNTASEYSNESVAFQANNRHYSYFEHDLVSPEEQTVIIRHSAPNYWHVNYTNPNNRSRYRFYLSTEGDLFRTDFRAPDDMPGERLRPHEAEEIAKEELNKIFQIDWEQYTRIDAQSVDRELRMDHIFAWHTEDPVASNARLRIDATIVGDELKSWNKSIEFPREFLDLYDSRQTAYNLISVSQVIIALVFWIIALFIFAFRFRSDEVSIRNGLVVATLMLGVLTLFWVDSFDFLKQLGPQNESDFGNIARYINIGLQVFFTSFWLLFVWTAGESIGREYWPAKLKSIDGILARRFFFPELGQSILRGFSLGFTQLGIWYGLALLVATYSSFWPIISTSELQLLSAASSQFLFIPVAPLTYALSTALLAISYAILFGLGFFKRLTKNTFVAILIPWLIFSGLFLDIAILLPIWVTSLIGLATGLLIYIYYFRYDALTVFVGVFLFSLVPGLFLYAHQSYTPYYATGGVGFLCVAGLFLYGILARTRGTELSDRAVEPAYVRNISERQRMKLELDVARQAQLQMLPQTIPSREGLDIAAFSEPAKEVGGDYFDFFELNQRTLGFAVGDVSGKGISAALYMTMLKGSLQSQAMHQPSPKELLSHINRTFFKSADKTTYVTLLYGVIDIQENLLTFARAGHNPILIYRSKEQTLFFLKPPGLGIGLEKGDVFERVLAEESFALQQGDTIIIYTDGLTEARNTKDEEFGEDRLTELIKARPFDSAEELLQRIKSGYFAFTGRAEAHDDLTCMVIRVQ